MEIKLCKKCGVKKEIDNFRLKKDKNGKYYKYSYCKNCEKEYAVKNIERKRKYDKKYREKNKAKIREKARTRKKYMSIEEKEKNKQYLKTYMPIWRSKNKDKIKKYYMKDNERRKNNHILHFKDQIRHEILRSFKSKSKVKNKHTEEILGCNIDYFINYILQTYKNNYGNEWDGKEKVHIDHIIPLATANTKEEIMKLCHHSNLQLLKASDNLKKSCKLNWELLQ